MESHDETGCQSREGPILCVNNCGFFGSAATMNMCSKCHKDMMMKEDQAKLAASSIGSIVNGNTQKANAKDRVVEAKIILTEPSRSSDATPSEILEVKPKEGPNRCASCQKRVGLTGFSCKCGNLFCATHRYSEKHDCPFDYRAAGRDAISKSNPVIKADKLDKI